MNKSRFAFLIFLLLVLPLTSFNKNDTEVLPKDKFVVVLDAGHGGHDPGNIGNGYLEKEIALAIVLRVGKELEKHPDIKVVYTRNDDTFIDLFVRGEIANEANADLFVSVHCNAHNSNAYGTETYVLGLHANRQNFEVAKKENSVIYLEDDYEQRYAEYDINSPESVIGLTIMQEEFLDQSIQLGKKLQDNFTKGLKRKDRKVKQAGFIVLHQTFMPSVLVEAGFLTNKNEGSYLNSKEGQEEMGKAIADAVLAYKEEMGFTPTPVANTPKVKDDEVAATVPKDSPEKQEEVKEKQPEKKSPEIQEEKEAKEETGVVFKVQLMASGKNIALNGSNFNGLGELSKEPYKNLFRYMYGNANTFEEAKKLKKNADAKGYATSYIVAYKDGLRIPITDALK
ncbi:N-acetylmuramoyl-L-alanine amidase [Allomuricauda ruestringensis DSM 13258]|uniref:N-acetylmuramoyl-L-alanine amidase n=1 Tax=Allomuricauda ruestringensis (strain DSM 13258 / CIP 107369 / LMG 19739 / B1) TaxID=886377 RepID=G2PNF7_ALLRU|nr:N-acetylmuramoyl-L-alanine amidase [Allomuricauda ruestringensis]AEM71337.1 N-acetylmuramoyl-L-alanine amidase [Allomuricauda ruestringensis DSM 13258]